MADVLKIVRGISQVMANTYDGALDENGDPIAIGLKREEGIPLIDQRVQDGFNVSFYGDLLCVKYHSDLKLKEVHAKGFATDVERMIENIVSFLKKEYRKVTKESLSLSKEGEIDIQVQAASKVRSWVTAKCYYKVGSFDGSVDQVENVDRKDIDKSFKDFLEQGSEQAKKPQNVMIKEK